MRAIRLVAALAAVLHSTSVWGIIARKTSRIARSNEYRIKKMVLRHYDMTTRPVKDDNTTVTITLAISLYHILDTNEKEQTFTTVLSIRQSWKDEYLTWNKSEYGNLKSILIPANQIWTPDLVISNFAGDKFNDFMVTNAIVKSDGSVLWLYPALIKTYCNLNVKLFPFDSQKCHIEFVSWTHNGYQVDLVYNESQKNAVLYNPANQEWQVDGITPRRREKKYACCAEPFVDVTFFIHLRRGSLFYIVNLIGPCFLIFLISFLGFFLPVESGEKVNLQTTILLALVVFLLMVGEIMPPTPDDIPLLGMFFGVTMIMVSVALVMAVVVTNLYARKDDGVPCPRILARIAMKWYPELFPDAEEPVAPVRHQHRKYDCNGRGVPLAGAAGGPGEREMDLMFGSAAGCCSACRDTEDTLSVSGGEGIVYRGPPPRQSSTQTMEKLETEWRAVSKMVNRVFFWIFVGITSISHTMMFKQMVPESPVKVDD